MFIFCCPRVQTIKRQCCFAVSCHAVDDFGGAVDVEHTTIHNAICVDEILLEFSSGEKVGEKVSEGGVVEPAAAATPAAPAAPAAATAAAAAFVGVELVEEVGALEGFIHIEENEVELAIVAVAEQLGVIVVGHPVFRTYVKLGGEVVAHLVNVAEVTDLFPNIVICRLG